MAERGWIAGTARAAGGSRNFKLWVPPTLERSQEKRSQEKGSQEKRTLEKERAWPLVMLLHGCTHDAEDMAEISGMNEVAAANQFLVVYPEQTLLANVLKCWNWCLPKHQTRDAGEPSILAAVVEQVCSTHNVDPDRVYLAGVSAGGAMASILAANYPDLFAAVAVFAGAEFKAAQSISEAFAVMKRGGPDPVRQGELAFEAMHVGLARKKRRRMPAIVFQGTEDVHVSLVNADQTIAQWSKTNACLAAEQAESEFVLTEQVIEGKVPGGYAYQRHVYVEADARLLMEKWEVQGLGHAWSGSPKRSRHGDPKGPNASAEIWRFFSEAGSVLKKGDKAGEEKV
jgi:poly(hydroxyalkanoate) depolymerase family esterase